MDHSCKISTCNLCGGKKFVPFIAIPHLDRNIVMCGVCGLAFVHPVNESFLTFDYEDNSKREGKYDSMRDMAEETGKHDEAMINLEESTRTIHFKSRKEKIEKYLNRGRLLDVGCGRGFFLRNFTESAFDIYGVEPRKRISQEAAKRVGAHRIYCGTLMEAEYPDQQFDVVTMINLIEHLPTPRQTLEEVNRIMKTGGILVVETPNVGSLAARLLGKKWHAFLEPEHHYFFSKKTLTEMLKRTGFSVIKAENGHKLFSIRYLLYRLGWYNLKLRFYLEKIMSRSRLIEATVKIPQFDESIIIAKKVSEAQVGT